jgi:hypothetical protein
VFSVLGVIAAFKMEVGNQHRSQSGLFQRLETNGSTPHHDVPHYQCARSFSPGHCNMDVLLIRSQAYCSPTSMPVNPATSPNKLGKEKYQNNTRNKRKERKENEETQLRSKAHPISVTPPLQSGRGVDSQPGKLAN